MGYGAIGRRRASTAAANSGVGWIVDRRHAENVPALAAAVGSTAAAVGRAGFAETGGSDVAVGALSARAPAVRRMMARAASHRTRRAIVIPHDRPDAAGVQARSWHAEGDP
jgi:hypothetical protein